MKKMMWWMKFLKRSFIIIFNFLSRFSVVDKGMWILKMLIGECIGKEDKNVDYYFIICI